MGLADDLRGTLTARLRGVGDRLFGVSQLFGVYSEDATPATAESAVPLRTTAQGDLRVSATVSGATDAGELPAPITPGDADANAATTYIAARLQATNEDGAWQRVRVLTTEPESDSPGLTVRIFGEQALRDTASSTSSIDSKLHILTPNQDISNTALPGTVARLEGWIEANSRWHPVCVFNPAVPDPPGTACALWAKVIDEPQAIRMQLVDGGTGNQALFISGTPDPTEPGLAVRLVPGGPVAAASAQSVVVAASGSPQVVPEWVNSAAFEAAHVVRAAPGSMFEAIFYNNATAGRYIFFCDQTTGTSPSGTIVHRMVVPPKVGTTVGVASLDTRGIPFTTGLVWLASTTLPTFTAAAADLWGQVSSKGAP